MCNGMNCHLGQSDFSGWVLPSEVVYFSKHKSYTLWILWVHGKNVGFRLLLCSFVVRCYPDFTCTQGSCDPTSLEHKPFSSTLSQCGAKAEVWLRGVEEVIFTASFNKLLATHPVSFPPLDAWLIVVWSLEILKPLALLFRISPPKFA